MVVLLVGLLVLAGKAAQPKPAVGEAVPIQAANHVPEGTEPGPYNTNPPTSGPHYDQPLAAGFYDEKDRQELTYPEGYLVHNLEHGYVIFWYDCDTLTSTACDDLKSMIRSVMDEVGMYKVIAFPYPGLEVPLVITSWGRQERLLTPRPADLRAFVLANRNRAPEPGAP